MNVRLAALAPLLAAALAAPAAAQLNLSWDDCGAAGTELRTWACDANPTVVARAYASFVVPPSFNITALTGAQAEISLFSAAPTLPAWWQMGTNVTGSCRPNGVAVDFNIPCANATDYWGAAVGGTYGGFGYFWGPNNQFSYSYPPSGARLRTVQAVSQTSAGPIGPGQYYLCTITIKGMNTVGTGACAGCTIPVGIVFSSLLLTQPAGVGDYTLSIGADRMWADWQCPGFPVTDNPAGFVFDCVTPAKQKTWGQIKSLYR